MRSTLRFLLVAGAVLAPSMALAQNPVFGDVARPDCSDVVDLATENGELYALKLTSNAANRDNDWLFDLREKGGQQSGATAGLSGYSYSVGASWAVGQGDDAHFIYVTMPATGPGQPARLLVDTAKTAGFSMGVTAVQFVGQSLATGVDGGINMVIPGTSARFSATLRPGVQKQFPVGATPSGSASYGSVNIAFSPIAEVNGRDVVPGSGCFIGGDDLGLQAFNPQDMTRGAIIGYNVYRIPGVGSTVPTHANFMAAVATDTDTDGGWVYFLDLRTFNVALADTNPGAPTPGGPDQATTDLAGLQNPDGRMYSGDEVMIYQDNANNAGVGRLRAAELAPTPGQSYWYAVQPVVWGSITDTTTGPAFTSAWATTGFTNNDTFAGNHQLDLDADGQFDAIDLDLNGTPEFISPQGETENGAQVGLGLTAANLPLLSAPMFYDGSLALPAFGQVSLSGSASGTDVNVQFTTGLEKASVMGYNVYRVNGEQRVRVNEQPILAQGNESNVYSLVDTATRARGTRSVSYMVEIVYTDGTPSTMVGPFSVSVGDQQPVRRRR